MGFKVDWVGEVALGIVTERGTTSAFSLEEGQIIPKEFQPNDEVEVDIHMDHPTVADMGMENRGYYEITHIASGKVLKTWQRADSYKLEGPY